MDSQTVYCYFWAYLFSTFSFSVFTLFSCRFRAVLDKLIHVGFRAHVKTASRIVSYRMLVCVLRLMNIVATDS